MQSVSQVSAPLGRVPLLTVKEFQAVTTAPPVLLRGARGTVGPPTWAQLIEMTLELAPWSFVFEKLFQPFPQACKCWI